VSWVNHELEEGACAPTAAITIAGSLLTVRPADSPRNGTGWNVYVGTAPDAMLLQNTAPLDPGENWIQMTEPAAGRKPGNGQEPDHMQRVPRVLQRG